MLRGSRSHESLGPVDLSRPSTPRELILAVAPLPGAQTFRISGWPRWLVPPGLSLPRSWKTKDPP